MNMPLSERAKKTIAKIRTCVFWITFSIIIFIIASLLFPYDRVAEQLIVGSASQIGVDISFDNLDFRFPNRIVCNGVTVTPRGENPFVGRTYLEDIDCIVALKPLMDKKLDLQRFRGTLNTRNSEEGNYAIEGAFLVLPGSGTARPRHTITIHSFAVQGEKVNLELRGNVTTTGSLNSTAWDLSADIKRLDRATSADKSLSTMFTALKFAMVSVESDPPVRLSFTGVGTNVKVDRLPSD